MKLVTIVVPNYDCEEYLDKCLESVTSQTYTNLEIIVCDNGSSDNSVSIINKWAAKDARIKVLINEVNQGLVNCYNRMFFAATGDYVMIQDADDWCDVKRAEKQAAILDKYDVGLCLTNAIYYEHFNDPKIKDGGPSRMIDIHTEEVWAPATIMFRREILDTVPGFNVFFHKVTSYDRYLILEILHKYGGYYLDDPLYHVWVRPNSDHRTVDISDPNFLRKTISYDVYKELKRQRIATGTDWLKENNLDALKKYENSLLNDHRYIADKLRTFACIQIDYGNYKEGRRLLKAAFKKSPFLASNYRSFLYYLRARQANNPVTN